MMEQHLIILLFFSGIFPSVLSEYFLVQQEKTWTDAQIYCRAVYTDLAIIKSNNDVIRLQNEAQIWNFNSNAWIGLYNDINGWHWSLYYEPLGSLRPWDVGEPNNWRGIQSCGAITSLGWWDVFCTQLYPFICYDETKIGSDRYIYISNKVQWLEAQTYCRQYYTDLASARDANENSVLQKKISGLTWFGLTKDPWKWVDNTNFSTISWMSGQPDNSLWNETCGYLSMGQAADAQCTKLMPFFCYAKTTKQIVRMKIKSDQELNNSAVNTVILEQLKQKLKELGMNNDIILKWRVKPDGEMFHKETKSGDL